jgi:hypothetical protein
MRTLYPVLFTTAMLLPGCAVVPAYQTAKPGDLELNCVQLQSEYADAEHVLYKAEKPSAEIALSEFFFPAFLGTHSIAIQAISEAEARKAHVAQLMNQKGCARSAGPIVGLE